MAIATARIQIGSTWHSLTRNNSTGKWEANINAPGTTSFNQPGGYYPATIEAIKEAGTSASATSSDPALGASLRLAVRETVKPTVTITSPGNGAHLATATPMIAFQLRDEPGGSGLKISTLALKVDSSTFTSTSPGLTTTPVTDGYNCTYTPQTALSDGGHTVTVTVSDNDSNVSAADSVSFVLSTVPPELNVSAPLNGLITAQPVQTVTGVTNTASGSPVTVTLTLDGEDQGAVAVDGGGNFSKDVTLAEGANTIAVTSTDLAGQVSSVTIGVLLDTTVPVFKSVIITPNPADAGATVFISAEIE